MRRLIAPALFGWLLLLPDVVSAQEKALELRDIERVLPTGNNRCRPLSTQTFNSESEGINLFVPNGWEISLHTVFTEQPAQGLMFEIDKSVSDNIKLRLGSGMMVVDRESIIGDIYFDESMQMTQFGFYVDWNIFPADISVVGGMVMHDTRVDLTAWPKPGLIYSLNGRLYTSAELGIMHAELSYESPSPYIGIAWRKPLGPDSPWRFRADLGTLFNMQPSLSLRSDSTISGINDDLAAEARQLESEFADQFIIAALGLSYAF